MSGGGGRGETLGGVEGGSELPGRLDMKVGRIDEMKSLLNRISLAKTWLQGAVVVGGGLPILIYGAYLLAYRGRVYPGVRIVEMAVGNNSIEEAKQKVEQLVRVSTAPIIRLEVDGKTRELNLNEMNLNYDPERTASQAFGVGRNGEIARRWAEQWRAWWEGMSVPLVYEVDEDRLEEFGATMAAEIDRPAIPPTLVLDDKQNQIEVRVGERGRVVDQPQFLLAITQKLQEGNFSEAIEVPIKEEKILIDGEAVEAARQRAEKLKDKRLLVTTEEQRWDLDIKEVINFINLAGGWEKEKIATYAGMLAETINRLPQNAAFRFENGRVIEFRPGKDGLKIDEPQVAEALIAALEALEKGDDKEETVRLTVARTSPAITTEKVNSFGIKDLLGRGTSIYKGSIPSRVHNVSLSAQRISGVLVAPGETFSFNQAVGEVAEATGYQQAYVIRSGRTVLDDGGGVCQTSTTLFRAVMDAGLPIGERRAHSYRVGYYEQNAKPGLDATVFAPSVDFKFLNDTPAYLLIQTSVDAPNRRLTIEIYGTSDGRKGEIVNHQVWDQAPPPPDLYQDDPSIPSGQVKQVDWSAWGAKVKFDYVVKRGGEQIYSKTFYQVYRPWQAVFLKGTGGQ